VKVTEAKKEPSRAVTAGVGMAIVALAAFGLYSCSGGDDVDVRQIAGPGTLAIVVPEDATADQLPELARKQCEGQQICQLFAWPKGQPAATAMPLTDKEAASVVYSYSLNRMTGLERSLWRCSAYPRASNDECLG
jgi:hypothetical protein